MKITFHLIAGEEGYLELPLSLMRRFGFDFSRFSLLSEDGKRVFIDDGDFDLFMRTIEGDPVAEEIQSCGTRKWDFTEDFEEYIGAYHVLSCR